jgi:capsular exopolysaccharide synthesis family protein
MNPYYQASAKVQLEPSAESHVPYVELPAAEADFLATDAYVETQKQILEGESMASMVLDRLNLQTDDVFLRKPNQGIPLQQISDVTSLIFSAFGSAPPSEPDKNSLVKQLLASLEVQIIPGTRLIHLAYTSSDPDLSTRIVSGYLDGFLEQNASSRARSAIEAKAFLEIQLTEAKKNLKESEQQLTEYAREHDIVSIDENQNVILQRFTDMDRELTTVESKLIELEARQRGFKSVTVDNFPEGLENETIVDLENRLSALNEQLSSLSIQFGAKWPETLKVKTQISELEEQLNREKQRVIDRVNSDYEIAREHYELAVSRLRKQKFETDQLGENLVQYNLLQGDVATNRAIHDDLLKRLKELRVSSAHQITNIDVVEHPRVPDTAHWPNKAQYMALAMILGLFLGVGGALAIEVLDDSIKTSDEVERAFSVPCLSVIPSFNKLTKSRGAELLPSSGKRNQNSYPVILNLPDNDAWEAYRYLRASITSGNSTKEARSILITSALPNEGKTTTAINLGVSLAQSGRRTALMDLNFRNPSAGDVFGIEQSEGLSAFLQSSASLHKQLRETNVSNLFVLPAGSETFSPAEQLSSERLEMAVQLLKQFFDSVVIDSPALLRYTDALSLAGIVDDVVLVIRGGSTPKGAVYKVISHLRKMDANLLGTVINSVDISKPEYTYDYGQKQAS